MQTFRQISAVAMQDSLATFQQRYLQIKVLQYLN
jgi:hypothetical protein